MTIFYSLAWYPQTERHDIFQLNVKLDTRWNSDAMGSKEDPQGWHGDTRAEELPLELS